MKTQPAVEQEQGFANEQATEIIQYNYSPSYQNWRYKKQCCSYQKHYAKLKLINNENLINQNIRNQWLTDLYDAFSRKKQHNIVFNNQSNTAITFQQQNIKFQSDFQSGNLAIINKLKQNHYDLYMKPDSNTKSHFQWFYFKVYIKKGQKSIKFSIRNFIKSTMLYSKGLRPYCRSLKNPQYHQFKQIQNDKVKFEQDKQDNFYNLQFIFNFQYDKDEVQFCSQPPYTLTNLNNFLPSLTKCKRLTLGKTVLDQKIPYLIYQAKVQAKIVCVVIARQHPGQAVGSWMMEGFLKQLQQKYCIGKLANSNKNISLDYITWIIVPMINIDGVILGNNRTGVLGHDFNRNWYPDQFTAKKNSKLFPESQAVINLMKSLRKKYPRKVKMFLDLHGHSSQPNVFTYGPPHQPKSDYFFQCRLFPQLLAKKNSNFNLNQCSYQIHPDKKQTARSVIFYNFGVPYTYTIQSTFGVMNGKTVTIDDFLKIGADIHESASQFLMATLPNFNGDNSNKIIQAIKIKYADSYNDGEQYESASQASGQDPNRDKIQQLIINDKLPLEKDRKSSRKSKRYSSQRHRNTELITPLRKGGRNSTTITNKVSICKSIPYKNLQKKRINTDADFLVSRNQCALPTIKSKVNNRSFDQKDEQSEQANKSNNFKAQDLQKRLYRLRNSKIGKKILVINAYYS